MTNLTQLLTRIKPCDTTRPYIFISYSSRDSETVWQDVLEFQQNGYNVWLDERNLDKTKESWRIDARRAISSRYCQLILFYVSATSMCSEPCLQELKAASSEQTKDYHNDKAVPILAVDVEEIDDITVFCDQIYQRLYREVRNEEEFGRKAKTLRSMMKSLFPRKNNRVRILARRVSDRKLDYYEDIQQNFGMELRPLPAEAVPAAAESAQPAEEAAPPAPAPSMDSNLHTVKTLGTTDIKYHICTFGSAFHIGFGAPVTVVMDGIHYERKMHNATKGRVDGMKQLYADHDLKLGDVLDARYSAAERTIYLTRKDSAQ